MKKNIILTFLVCSVMSLYAQSGFRINEFGYGCQQSEDCPPRKRAWIELSNDSPVIIEGELYLTDDVNNLTKWGVKRNDKIQIKIKREKYLLIGLNGRVKKSYYVSDAVFSDTSIVYLVLKDEDGLTIVDQKKWSPINEKTSTGVSNVNDSIWSENLYPTPKYNNFELGSSRPRSKFLLTVSPFAIASFNLGEEDGQEIKPIYSYRLGVHHNIIIMEEVDFQYGFSISRLGYSSVYEPATETSPFATRERKSEGKIRGRRYTLDLKAGVEVVPKLYAYLGFDIGLYQPTTTSIVTTQTITKLSDNTSSSTVVETKETAPLSNYTFGTIAELEYSVLERLSANLVINRTYDFGTDSDLERNSLWQLSLGVKFRFARGRKHVEKVPLLELW